MGTCTDHFAAFLEMADTGRYSHDVRWFISALDAASFFPPLLLFAGEGGLDILVTCMCGLDLTPRGICHRQRTGQLV